MLRRAVRRVVRRLSSNVVARPMLLQRKGEVGGYCQLWTPQGKVDIREPLSLRESAGGQRCVRVVRRSIATNCHMAGEA